MSSCGGNQRHHLKTQIAKRDGSTCFYCQQPFDAKLDGATLDHLIPQSVMPGWNQANLVLACRPCNIAKADRLPQVLLRPTGYGPGLMPIARLEQRRAPVRLAVGRALFRVASLTVGAA
jgi:hypothetical protein